MGCKYVKEFEFGGASKPKSAGYAKGGRVDPEVREAVHKHERNMHPKEPLTPMKSGGLYANIHAKRARIEAGSGEKMNKVGSGAAPSAKDFKDAAKTAKKPKK